MGDPFRQVAGLDSAWAMELRSIAKGHSEMMRDLGLTERMTELSGLRTNCECAGNTSAVGCGSGPRRTTAASVSRQSCENGHDAIEDLAAFAGVRLCRFEVEEIENGEALERAAAGDRVAARLVARAGPPGALRDVERDAQAGAVELVGEFGALEREPADHVRAKHERETVGVKPVQGSGWREGCNGSGGGIHQRRPF